MIDFQDGNTTNYSSNNFDSEIEKKKYNLENLFFPHDTLPIGEFAIDNYTKASKMGCQYNIMNLLPVLILEKTGPHFFIGDTCFTREKDHAVKNPFTDKLICSKDNVKSILRKTDPILAYMTKYEDIFLPFDDIEFIIATSKSDERLDLIKDGRSVLAGTEELNVSLDEF